MEPKIIGGNRRKEGKNQIPVRETFSTFEKVLPCQDNSIRKIQEKVKFATDRKSTRKSIGLRSECPDLTKTHKDGPTYGSETETHIHMSKDFRIRVGCERQRQCN